MGSNGDGNVLREMLKHIEKKFDEKFEILLNRIDENNSKLRTELCKATSAIETLEKKNQVQKEKILILEKKIRRNNIAIFGSGCQKDNLLSCTINTLNDLLNVNINDSEISNIYQPITQGKAPIIVEFTRNITKLKIFAAIKPNLAKLKESGIWIAHDLSKEEREIQTFLRKHLKEAKIQNKTAKIVGNNLWINGNKHTYESLKSRELDTDKSDESDLESVFGSEESPGNKTIIKIGANNVTTNTNEEVSIKPSIGHSPSLQRKTRQSHKKKK